MSIHQIVYCSRNRIEGSAQEVDSAISSILVGARSKNKSADVSGALLFNGAAFAQVLEGPLSAVEEIFEAIQCDPRHTEVVVLHNGESSARCFSDWSMAYADPGAVHAYPNASIDLDAAFADAATGGPRIVRLLESLVARAGAANQ